MEIDIKLPVEVRAQYRFKITNTETGKATTTDWMDNLITDGGLQRLMGGGLTSPVEGARYAFVGTGQTTPEPTETRLSQQSGGPSGRLTGGGTSNTGSPDYIFSCTMSFVFPQGQFNGVTLTEVGVGPFSDGENLISRALISPPIVVNAIDQLTVEWRYDSYIPQGTFTGTIDVTGGPSGVNYTISAGGAAGSSWMPGTSPSETLNTTATRFTSTVYTGCTGIGGIEADAPEGSTSSAQSQTDRGFLDYTSGRGRARFKYPTNEGNFGGGINGLSWITPFGKWKMFLDAAIMKANTDELEFIVTLQLSRH